MNRRTWSLLSVALMLIAGPVLAGGIPTDDSITLGVIKAPSFDQAKARTFAWLNEVNKDATAKAEALWNPAVDRPLLDRVAESFMLADGEALKLITDARNANSPAPTAIPEVLKNTKSSAFYRANLALYYAKQLATRRLHEEALQALTGVRPEQVVDPASYYFFKAVAENKLRQREEGLMSVERLLNSVADAPERYIVVATLMKIEMLGWKDDDLGDIARRMEEIEGRLGNARGGPKTQGQQKEVIAKLSKMIEDLEKQCGNCQCAGGKPGSNIQSSSPAPDSMIIGGIGKGEVDPKKLIKDAKLWGNLPEKDRIKALEAIVKDYPPHMREAIEGYLRELAKGNKKD